MNLTASQIRQDLTCFGGFGQQGYGYNVDGLRGEIRNILGLDYGFTAIAVGIGNLGRAVINHMSVGHIRF
jgi:redox-sensing transcriptional repressor